MRKIINLNSLLHRIFDFYFTPVKFYPIFNFIYLARVQRDL